MKEIRFSSYVFKDGEKDFLYIRLDDKRNSTLTKVSLPMDKEALTLFLEEVKESLIKHF